MTTYSNKLRIMLDEGAHMPTRSHEDDAGLDLYAPESVPAIGVPIDSFESAGIDTGVHVLIPRGYVGLVCPRSGLNIRHCVLPGIGVIDAGYTGTIIVRLYNHNYDAGYRVHPGDRIAQLLILPIWYLEPELVESFPETERGDNGYGSTGR